ncbi:hypothetical protein D3C71_1070940 [compost metagenome]
MQLRGQDAGLVGGLQHHGAGAVAEQHAGTAVIPVQDARKHLGADNQRATCAARADEAVGGGQRVHEAAAHGLHIESRRTLGAQIGLHQASRAGKHKVRGGRGHHDEVDFGSVYAGIGQRAARGLGGQLAGGDATLGQMALPDARAFDNPLIRGGDVARRQLRCQLVIRNHAFRQEAAGARDHGIFHCGIHQAVSPATFGDGAEGPSPD